MTWQTIAASETDANSPLNQTLMDKIRENLDDLHAGGAQLLYFFGPYSNNDTSVDIILDAERDWRDRMVEVKGVILQGSQSNIDSMFATGGGNTKIGSHYAAQYSLRLVQLEGWMYTSLGGATKLADPHVYEKEASLNDPEFYLWVDSTTGALKLHATTSRASGSRNLAYLLRLIYSADLGGH
jgi:hypothetical protein